MARYYFQGVSVDKRGNVIGGATISVYLSGTTTPANIYTSATPGGAAVNSVTSSSATTTLGQYGFYVDNFDYNCEQDFDLTVGKLGYSTQTYTQIGTMAGSNFTPILGVYTISAPKNADTHMRVAKGVQITKGGTGTITFSNLLDAGPYQIFYGFASGDITGLRYADPAWWGGGLDGYNKAVASLSPSGVIASFDYVQGTIAPGTTAQYYRGDKSWQTLNATAVGLGNVTNDLQLRADQLRTAMSSSSREWMLNEWMDKEWMDKEWMEHIGGVPSDLYVLTEKAVYDFVTSSVVASVGMRFVGVLDCSTNPNYPASTQGDTYAVSVSGKIGGASGVDVVIGDWIICNTNNGGGDQATVGSLFNVISAGTAYEPYITPGTSTQYWRGDKTWQTLNQAAVDDLMTSDSPTFVGLTLSGATAGQIGYFGATKNLTGDTLLTWDYTNKIFEVDLLSNLVLTDWLVTHDSTNDYGQFSPGRISLVHGVNGTPVTDNHTSVSFMRYDAQTATRETAMYFFGTKIVGAAKGCRDGIVSYMESATSSGVPYTANIGINSVVGVSRIDGTSNLLGQAAYFDAALGNNVGAIGGVEIDVRNFSGQEAPATQVIGGITGLTIVGRGNQAVGASSSLCTHGIDFTAEGPPSLPNSFAFKSGIHFQAGSVWTYGVAIDASPLGTIPALKCAASQSILWGTDYLYATGAVLYFNGAAVITGSFTMDTITDGSTYHKSHNDFTDTYKGYLNQSVQTGATPSFAGGSYTGIVTFNNGVDLKWKSSGGTPLSMLALTASDILYVGYGLGSGGLYINVDGTMRQVQIYSTGGKNYLVLP